MTAHANLADLLAIMARLRDPETGCPWDQKQTFRSILPFTLEEAYEVAEAIEREDMAELREELGDLLLQVVYHARIAEEAGIFDFADVVRTVSDKMVRRHPHVFGDAFYQDEDEARANWERQKEAERAAKRKRPVGSVLEGVAMALPALVRAEKLQKRAATVGFDWTEMEEVFEKVLEELQECRETLETESEPTKRVHEVGDLLFSCVNLARHMGVDAEQALRAANHRFERRFGRVEVCLRAGGRAPSAALRDEMERLWNLVKAEEP